MCFTLVGYCPLDQIKSVIAFLFFSFHLKETCTHGNYLMPFGQRLVATPENSGYEEVRDELPREHLH